jgi:hypothetical protein
MVARSESISCFACRLGLLFHPSNVNDLQVRAAHAITLPEFMCCGCWCAGTVHLGVWEIRVGLCALPALTHVPSPFLPAHVSDLQVRAARAVTLPGFVCGGCWLMRPDGC